MKTIEERAKEYSLKDFDGYYTGREKAMEEGYIAGATDQQAIDEKVRLKKSDDMTDAEYNRETAFADWYCINGKSTPTFSEAIEWSRKQTIDKVCDWLHLNLPNIEYTIKEPKPLRVSRGLLIDELRKAMEE